MPTPDKPSPETAQKVIERMMHAGWIRANVRNREFSTSALTDEGVQTLRSLRKFFRVDDGKISGDEVFAFVALVCDASLEFTD